MVLTGEYAPSPVDWVRDHVERYESSGGTDGTTLQGLPIVLLTSVGARSGMLRKNPLIRIERDGEYLAVASNGGQPKHPVWYHNLIENPRVELRDGTVTGDYTAREVTGDERAVWWERALAVQPGYAGYQAETTREIPLFVLTPLGPGA